MDERIITRISALTAVVAIVLSIISIGLQYRTVHDLNATVVFDWGYRTGHVFIRNTGNVNEIIYSVQFDYSDPEKGPPGSGMPKCDPDIVMCGSCSKLPVSVSPNETLTVPLDEICYGTETQLAGDYLSLFFEVISPNGNKVRKYYRLGSIDQHAGAKESHTGYVNLL